MRATARRGRWRLGLALLVAPVGVASPLAGCGTPASTADQADPSAEVALLAVVEGAARVRRAGGDEVAAAADMALTRGDTVITSPGALVVVVLANGYVIRLEEDQVTPVRALAHLDDPPAREDLSELFERALGAEAFARVGGADRIERIAGWNARRASGETPAPVTRSEPAPRRDEAPAADVASAPAEPQPEADDLPGIESEEKRESESIGRGDSDGAAPRKPVKVDRPQNRPQDDVGEEKAKKSTTTKTGGTGKLPPAAEPSGAPASPAGGSAPDAKDAPEPDLANGWTFEAGDGGHVKKTSLPALLAGQRRALGKCLAEAGEAELRLRVVGGVVKEVALAGGRPGPGCAKGLVGRPLPEAGGDGWVVVRARP